MSKFFGLALDFVYSNKWQELCPDSDNWYFVSPDKTRSLRLHWPTYTVWESC